MGQAGAIAGIGLGLYVGIGATYLYKKKEMGWSAFREDPKTYLKELLIFPVSIIKG